MSVRRSILRMATFVETVRKLRKAKFCSAVGYWTRHTHSGDGGGWGTGVYPVSLMHPVLRAVPRDRVRGHGTRKRDRDCRLSLAPDMGLAMGLPGPSSAQPPGDACNSWNFWSALAVDVVCCEPVSLVAAWSTKSLECGSPPPTLAADGGLW